MRWGGRAGGSRRVEPPWPAPAHLTARCILPPSCWRGRKAPCARRRSPEQTWRFAQPGARSGACARAGEGLGVSAMQMGWRGRVCGALCQARRACCCPPPLDALHTAWLRLCLLLPLAAPAPCGSDSISRGVRPALPTVVLTARARRSVPLRRPPCARRVPPRIACSASPTCCAHAADPGGLLEAGNWQAKGVSDARAPPLTRSAQCNRTRQPKAPPRPVQPPPSPAPINFRCPAL